MFRFLRHNTPLALICLAIGCNVEPPSQSVATNSSVNTTMQADTQPVRVDANSSPIEATTVEIDPPEVGAVPLDATGGAPAPPPPELITRDAYLAMVDKTDQLRDDIRATNPKLQLIVDGKFDEFAKLLDDDPRLATLRWGYYADKPDPLNPTFFPRGGPCALELAAKHGSLELVRRLATPEVLVDDSVGNSALALAANVKVAEELIEGGVKIPTSDPASLESPYRIAAENGNLALCQWLRAQAPKTQLDVEVVNGQYWRPIGFACENGHLDVVKWFAAQGVPLTLIPGTLTDESGWGIHSAGSSPLARAAAGGQVEVIKYLLVEGGKADLNAQVDLAGSNAWDPVRKIEYSPALCSAAAAGHVDVVKLLLDEGAQVTSRGGLNPLHMAALHGQEDVFKVLRERGAKITTDQYVTRVEETTGIDLLCCAVRGGNTVIFEQVIDNWPRAWLTDESCSDMYHYYQGRGPLAVAVSADHAELVNRMIELSETAEADERKTALNHALTAAVETDNAAMVKLLHAVGAPLDDPLLAPSPGGENSSQSPIARAAAHGSCEVLRYLAQQEIDVDQRDEAGRTLLHRVCRKEFAPQPKLFADQAFRSQVIACLLELGASPNAKDKAGRSILHDAVYYLEPEEVSLLIDHRASPMVHDADGESPATHFERLLAGKYKDADEPRPWIDGNDQPPKRTASSWRERIRVEENLKLLQ